MLIGVKLPLFAGKEVVAQNPGSKKNDAKNKRSRRHGAPIYSIKTTIWKRFFAPVLIG
jgi:hypothetical protein